VAEARDTEAIVLHGSDLPTWAVPGNVTAKLPVTDLSCIAAVQDGCAHNHYAKPELDSSTVAAPSGPDVTRMTGWRWNGKAFQGVPFQVDEVFTRYLDNSASGYAVYSGEDQHTTYAFDREGFRYPKGTCVATPDPPHGHRSVKGLDTDDEPAFMAADTGAQAPTGAAMPKGISKNQRLTVLDPSTRKHSCLYVMLGRTPSFTAKNGYVHYQRDANADRLALSQSSYDSYGNAAVGPYCDATGKVIGKGRRRPLDNATMTTDRYRYRYDGRWLMTDAASARTRARPTDPTSSTAGGPGRSSRTASPTRPAAGTRRRTPTGVAPRPCWTSAPARSGPSAKPGAPTAARTSSAARPSTAPR
jgi:hypothetical protein